MQSTANLRCIQCHVNHMTFDAPNQNNRAALPFEVRISHSAQLHSYLMYPGLMRSLDRLLSDGALSDPFTLPATTPRRATLRPVGRPPPPPPPPPPPNPERLDPALEAARDWRPSWRWLTSDCLDWRRSEREGIQNAQMVMC